VSHGSLVVCSIVGVAAVVVVVANVATTRRLWASAIFERPQKIAQSILLWLVPGSVFVVRAVLREQTGRSLLSRDPTAENIHEQFGSGVWVSAHDNVVGGGGGGGGGGD
jgi:hypothetical protein